MILGALLLGLAASALSAFLYGYILMLGVLVVHNCWLPGVPTIGYWAAVFVAFTISCLIAPRPPLPD
jgi:hypothetical protein